MTFGQLRTFLELSRTGSVRRAAAALFVTEPSVSAAVSALQKDLGTTLVEREGRGVRLTAAGQELAQHAAVILGAVDRAQRAVREVGGGSRHLRLAAVTTAGEYVLPPLLKQFLSDNPGVQVSLRVGNRIDVINALLSHEADLAVAGRPPAGSEIIGRAFLDNPLVVVGAPGHHLDSDRAIDASVLSRETWLVREPGSGTRQTTEEFLAAAGIQPASLMTVGSNSATKSAAAVGLGVTLISADAVAAELAAGTLVRLNVKGTPMMRSWFALSLASAPLPPSGRAFLRFLLPDATGPHLVTA
jgi:DNA-binding transcriptional LysR family regulator